MTHLTGAPLARAACPPPAELAHPTPHPVADGIRARISTGVETTACGLPTGVGGRVRVLPEGGLMRVAWPQKPGRKRARKLLKLQGRG